MNPSAKIIVFICMVKFQNWDNVKENFVLIEIKTANEVIKFR